MKFYEKSFVFKNTLFYVYKMSNKNYQSIILTILVVVALTVVGQV